MHILEHGILNFNITLILQRALELKSISLENLNSKIHGWPYSYLDRNDVPEPLTRKQIYEDCQIKQTAGSTRHLSYILPLILHNKFPDNDPYYKNFMRLICISTICSSPIVSQNSAGELQVLIETFLINFKQLYPRIMLQPKFHWMLHFLKQMSNFGPLRCDWLYRYESKNNFIKQMKPQSFKNVAYSLMARCQLHACYQYLSGRAISENYLTTGDKVKHSSDICFRVRYPDLIQYYSEQVDAFDDKVYTSAEMTRNGLEYRPGAALLLSWDDNWPLFGQIDCLFIKNDVRFSVCSILEALEYKWKANAYIVQQSNQKTLTVINDMATPWPLPPYIVGGHIVTVNRYSHFSQGHF